MEKSIKGKIGVLVILGMFAAIALTASVTAVYDPGYSIDMDDEQWIGLSSSEGRILFDDTPTPDQIEILNANVGIGTTSPNYQLELSKLSGDPTIMFDIGGTDKWSISVDYSESDKFLIQTTGINNPLIAGDYSTAYVGIGTLSPDGLLDIEKEGTARSNLDIFHITNSGNAVSMAATETSILFNQYYYDGTPAEADAGRITVGTETSWTSTATTQDGYMAFYTVKDGTVSEKVRITSDGNVGIGTTSPTASLHVDQSSTTGAKPVLTVDQADVDEEFIRFIGTSSDGVLTQSIVEDADVTTDTLQGWLKVYVQDDGNQLTDQAYFIPIYTLT